MQRNATNTFASVNDQLLTADPTISDPGITAVIEVDEMQVSIEYLVLYAFE